MEGANIYQLAKNCRTSVEMIENFCAAHIKNTLDASQINVMRDIGRYEREEAPASRKSIRERGETRTVHDRRPSRMRVSQEFGNNRLGP
jgi:hypothetical protein